MAYRMKKPKGTAPKAKPAKPAKVMTKGPAGGAREGAGRKPSKFSREL